ncbi:molybdopterin-dependent oxidoreductase [Vibrio sp. Vb2880]|uniref:molybdopterin-dependent oxidoreductase n=1 Tax=Vibrio sp. Vb2880 TaxID=2816076 RepID=UPI001A8F3DE1|nr:molybdopterin-dependent oxidoreductase [Vibrio sp. Vb2880]MBO0213397.1 molybdopterin-dependent oxidoreductase [Vibrio sp. Vb2880]
MIRHLSFIWLLLYSVHSAAVEITVKVGEHAPHSMTLAQLQSALPVNAFTTHVPWLTEPHTFTGFTLTDLLKYLKVENAESVSLIALNDYAANIAIDDVQQYNPIVAYFLDGKPMRVRDKGPFWLVYNLSAYPQIDEPMHYTQMVWQIKEILIHTHD